MKNISPFFNKLPYPKATSSLPFDNTRISSSARQKRIYNIIRTIEKTPGSLSDHQGFSICNSSAMTARKRAAHAACHVPRTCFLDDG